MAHTSGFDASEIISKAHAQTGPHEPKRTKAQRQSLIRNRLILERLGCIDEAGMIKLRKGNAPTITKGPTPPFHPLCSGPKAASTPSRQKQIPSSDVINDW